MENKEQLYKAFVAGKMYYHNLLTDETTIDTKKAFEEWYKKRILMVDSQDQRIKEIIKNSLKNEK